MARSAFRSLARPCTPALLALAALGWVAPSRALASCGDYVTMGSGHAESVRHDVPLFPQFDSDSQPANYLATDLQLANLRQPHAPPRSIPCQRCPREPGKPPCQGPWCSDAPAPLPAPPSTVVQVEQQWACWWAAQYGFDGGRSNLHVLHDEQDRVHHVFPIYHPPRPI